MAVLQALFSLLARSAGKILNAIFGWAVVALFGKTSPKEQTMLSVLVAMAAAWPLLVLGIAFPKLTAFLIAFIPLSQNAPSSVVRIVWLSLALLVPLVVGVVVAKKAPATRSEPYVKRFVRGFPITFGLAGAFLLMFLAVPVLRLASAIRGRKDEHVPCITEGPDYVVVAGEIERILHRYRYQVTRTEPSWWLSGPSQLLAKLSGKALTALIPENMAYWKGPELEVAFYPSDILIRGRNKWTARVHGVLAEALARGPGLQTLSLEAQELERQIHQIWRVHDENPAAHRRSRALLSRVEDVASGLAQLKVSYDDWQVLYRATLQLDRVLRGEPQLLQLLEASSLEAIMQRERDTNSVHDTLPVPLASTPELVRALMQQTSLLVRKEIELIRVELSEDKRRELRAAKSLGVAGVCGILAIAMALLAIVLALAVIMPGWIAAAILAGIVLSIGTIAGIVGWTRRVKKPLERTQKTLKEDVQWAKERTA